MKRIIERPVKRNLTIGLAVAIKVYLRYIFVLYLIPIVAYIFLVFSALYFDDIDSMTVIAQRFMNTFFFFVPGFLFISIYYIHLIFCIVILVRELFLWSTKKNYYLIAYCIFLLFSIYAFDNYILKELLGLKIISIIFILSLVFMFLYKKK